MDPLRLFLLDQGFPVEYELDKFNTPHIGTTLRHPQNWLCRLRCRISPRHLATSPLGNIFWRHSRFSPKQLESQNSRWLQRFSPQTANSTFAKLWRKYLPLTSNNTRCFLNSIITSNRSLTSFLTTRLAA